MTKNTWNKLVKEIEDQITTEFNYQKNNLHWSQSHAVAIVTDKVMKNIKKYVETETKKYLKGEDFIDELIERIKRKQL